MEKYCAIYSRCQRELLIQKAMQGGEDYQYTIYTTWEISRRMIENMRTEAGYDALELLQMFSVLHYEGISEEIFRRAWHSLRKDRQSDWMLSHQPDILLRQSGQKWDFSSFRTAVSVLLSFSLIHRDKKNLIFIHPLVHAWVGDQLSVEDEDTTSTMALSICWTFQTADY